MTVKKMIKYREIWMGIAMIWIMAFHSDFVSSNKIVSLVKSVGYGGVDIFLFASGIGNYFSYTRDEKPLLFLKRRILRLAPVYIPFILVWNTTYIIMNRLSPKFFIGNLFGVQVFSNAGVSFNWYIAVLIVCYVLTPFLATFVKEHNVKQCCVLILVLILASTAFWTDVKFVISATRLPIYVIGMIFAKYSFKKIKPVHILVGSLLFAIGIAVLMCCFKFFSPYLWSYGLYWYPFIVITPFLCFLISVVASLTERIHFLSLFWDKIVKPFGKYSFEFYLVHIFCFEILSIVWEKLEIEHPINNRIWLLAFLMVLGGAWTLHTVSKPMSRIFEKIFDVH